jgi:hypothetical protein
MQQAWSRSGLKLTKTEIWFFVIIFVIFPMITDFEYHIYEKTGLGLTLNTALERLVYGILGMIPYLLYYKLIIPFLFDKKYLIYVALIAVFLVALNFSIHLDHWIVSKLFFLPKTTIASATRWFSFKPVLFQFSIIFVFRELLMITALAYFIRSSTQEKQMHTMRRQHLESELNYLKVQLQPHFFFNTLNNIYSLALQKSDQTAPLIARHAEMMRYILYYSKKTTVSLSQEIDFLKNYTEVEKLRHDGNADVIFETQGIKDSIIIEPFLLLPFIENAFKHGIREETGGGFVHILVCLTENDFTMEVVNSKPRIVAESVEKGIGIQNAVGRLDLLYPEHQLITNETDHEYEVSLTLTLAKHD